MRYDADRRTLLGKAMDRSAGGIDPVDDGLRLRRGIHRARTGVLAACLAGVITVALAAAALVLLALS